MVFYCDEQRKRLPSKEFSSIDFSDQSALYALMPMAFLLL